MPVFAPFNAVRAQNKAERVIECVSPLDPAIRRGVTDLYPSRGYTHTVTRAIEVSHTACKNDQKPLLVDLTHTAKVIYSIYVFNICIYTSGLTGSMLL